MKCRYCGSTDDLIVRSEKYVICTKCEDRVYQHNERKKQQELESHEEKKPGRPTTVKGMKKKCAKCGKQKSLSEFYFHARRKVYTSYCNDCRRQYQKDRNAAKNSRALGAEVHS